MVLAKSLDSKNTGWIACTWSHLNKTCCFLLLSLGGTFEFLPASSIHVSASVPALIQAVLLGWVHCPCLQPQGLSASTSSSYRGTGKPRGDMLWRYVLSTAPSSLSHSAALQQLCQSGRVGHCKVSLVTKHIPPESPVLGRTFEIPGLKPDVLF